MSKFENPSYSDETYEGCVTAGLATGRVPPPISDADLQRLDEAWNDPRAYHAAMAEAELVVTAGWAPKPVTDPDRFLLPGAEEIAKLPRWARVAFAARCARRVLPIVNKFWVNVPKQHLQTLDRAVRVAEGADIDDARAGVYAIARAAADVSTARTGNDATTYAAAAARYAVDTVADADAATYAASHATAARYAADVVAADTATVRGAAAAADAAMHSLCRVVTLGTIGHLAAPARDFDRLTRLAEKEKWTDDTPVPPTVFGPMWDGPPPEWWTDNILTDLPNESTAETEEHDESTFPLK
ncbi:hypothetical protein VT84_11785 [Gemmata sp. SH-PL17]|uniref:hypothetical protein n=1 Tax=Gemmata sp. SH-PL17 TaxID=1630693 RepID=UPI00078D6E28|nr:hypothetical protein [Gemmata sp. SH-PL17]AMV25070.1 hypothetical protein VT84_11785 [Gemmata sp. SH-PL17]